MKPARRRQTNSTLHRLWNRLPKHRRMSLLSTGALLAMLGLLFVYQRYVMTSPRLLSAEEELVGPELGEGALTLDPFAPEGPAVGVEPGGDVTGGGAPLPKLIEMPVTGVTAQGYAPVWSAAMSDWRWHEGLDLRAPQGTPVKAAAPGIVMRVEELTLDGLTVEIDHQNGLRSRYSGLTAPLVQMGDEVTTGQTIAQIGAPGAAESTIGPHLHFALEEDGLLVDPRLFLR